MERDGVNCPYTYFTYFLRAAISETSFYHAMNIQ